MTLDPLRVSTKVSKTLPATVPAGTAVTAVTAWRDSKVVAVPTWEMAAVGVDTSFGTVLMPAGDDGDAGRCPDDAQPGAGESRGPAWRAPYRLAPCDVVRAVMRIRAIAVFLSSMCRQVPIPLGHCNDFRTTGSQEPGVPQARDVRL